MAIRHKPDDDLSRERPSLGDWLNLRTGWYGFVQKNLDEPMPAGVGWWQTLGNLLLTLLVFQFASGFMLTLFYVPSPDHAHQSVLYINEKAWMGGIVRGIHHYGSSFIVVAIVLHILRTFFWGTYKRPRELTWVAGVLVFGIMLAFSFTGYLLPWDQKAYWATVVGTRMVETVPFVGDKLVVLVRGGNEVGALTLTRFYAIHVMALPMALMALTAGHLYLVRRLHIAGPVTRQKGRPVKFYPTQLFRDAVVLLVAVGWLLALAYAARPELGEVANPARVDFTPKPEWYFLGLYELLKLLPPQLESVGTFFIPMGMIAGMLALPWLDRAESRHPAKRRWIIDVAIVTILGIGILTLKGLLA